jgi:outer membrane lipoprotein carrier protein
MMRIWMFFTMFLFLAGPAFAAQKLPALLQEIEQKYSKAGTLEADFTQVNEVAALNQKKTSSGVIDVKRPGKLRWETLKPDKNLLVSDGKTFWFYTPPFEEGERGQVMERKSSQIQSKLASALLAGSFSANRDMKIQNQGPSTFVLLPKKGTAGTVMKAEVSIDLKKKLIQKVTLEHEGGNRSEITLSHIKLGEPLDERLFHFITPPNTDRVE